jgi:hypothetical protein
MQKWERKLLCDIPTSAKEGGVEIDVMTAVGHFLVSGIYTGSAK